MIRHLTVFFATFVIGALIALAARTATHEPHTGATDTAVSTATAAPDAHAHHHGDHASAADAKAKAPTTAKTVNTVCPICGMDVDPSLGTADYKGQKVGFGCAACPPKFKKNPDKWGPSALKNAVLED